MMGESLWVVWIKRGMIKWKISKIITQRTHEKSKAKKKQQEAMSSYLINLREIGVSVGEILPLFASFRSAIDFDFIIPTDQRNRDQKPIIAIFDRRHSTIVTAYRKK